MTSPRRSGFARFIELIFRPGALRAARAEAPKPTASQERAVDQARLLVEIARRVTEPVEALPRGSRTGILCRLYGDAVYWALVALQIKQGATPPSDLAQAWAATSPERLLAAAQDQATLTAVHAAFLDRTAIDSPDAAPDDVTRARVFAEALLWELDAPTRAVERIQVQRWIRTAAVAVALLALMFGIRALVRGPNLASAHNFKTSTSFVDCTAPNRCSDLLFHTLPQDNPWVDFDLGAVKAVHRVEVTNRSDCCSERAIPLIAEISVDDKTWVQVARRDAEFSVWKADFPKQSARYVRFRVPRNTALHFDDVVVR